ncbi:MAG: hypothetical protein JNL32_02100 [Candidatus Kapabacteria bacterium]|nr:hypothetical protein [Candidatus Kapabacteria bacterium]
MKEQMLVSVQIDTSGVWNNALRKNSTHQLKMQDIDSMVAIPDSLYARTDADFIVAILNFYVTFIDDRTIRSSGSVVGSVDEYYITAWCSIIDRKTKKRVHLFYASGSKSCSSDCSDVLQRSITDCIERTVNYLD